MPRKSRTLRIAQTADLIEKYTNAGLEDTRVCRFAKDMLFRLERGKALSSGRRKFLDDVIEQGVPEPKGDSEYIAMIDEAIGTPGASHTNVLRDFRGKLVRGWQLSEKQKSWCDSLIEKAKDIREDSYWRPDEELTERIKLAVSCYVCYSGGYWDTHPGGWRAMSTARQWVAGEIHIIDEYTVKKLFKSVAGKLREMENPKFQIGSICYHNNIPAIVLDGPIPTNSGIAYPVLVDGNVVQSTTITKRRTKARKS